MPGVNTQAHGLDDHYSDIAARYRSHTVLIADNNGAIVTLTFRINVIINGLVLSDLSFEHSSNETGVDPEVTPLVLGSGVQHKVKMYGMCLQSSHTYSKNNLSLTSHCAASSLSPDSNPG